MGSHCGVMVCPWVPTEVPWGAAAEHCAQRDALMEIPLALTCFLLTDPVFLSDHTPGSDCTRPDMGVHGHTDP